MHASVQRSANEISYLGPRDVRAFKGTAEDTAEIVANLHRFGIGLDARHVRQMMDAQNNGVNMLGSVGMDADLISPLTLPS